MKDFTVSAKGCRAALTTHLVKTVIGEGKQQVTAYLKRDNEKRLTKHAKFAQGVFRRKKGMSKIEGTLKRLKAEQSIFSHSSGQVGSP